MDDDKRKEGINVAAAATVGSRGSKAYPEVCRRFLAPAHARVRVRALGRLST